MAEDFLGCSDLINIGVFVLILVTFGRRQKSGIFKILDCWDEIE